MFFSYHENVRASLKQREACVRQTQGLDRAMGSVTHEKQRQQ